MCFNNPEPAVGASVASQATSREIAGFTAPDEFAARFGSGWTPFHNWQKDVFFTKGSK